MVIGVSINPCSQAIFTLDRSGQTTEEAIMALYDTVHSNLPLSHPVATVNGDAPVAHELLAQIADNQAHMLWGDDVARGEPLPVVDENGETVAYIFPYLRGAQHFPDQESIMHEWQSLQRQVDEAAAADRADQQAVEAALDRFGSQYGAIYVSARQTVAPILKVTHFLHPFFRNGLQAQAQSALALQETAPRLQQIYLFGPHEEYFEFAAAAQTVLINVDSLEQADKAEKVAALAFAEHAPAPVVTRDIVAMWQAIEQNAPQRVDLVSVAAPAQIEKIIPYGYMIPVIDWTHWCLITAEAMVLGFYDTYARGRTFTGFGRLIDYWYEHPSNGHNVPNFIDTLANPGPNPAGLGRMAKVAHRDGYEFVDKRTAVSAQNDWGWNIVKREIDAGRPVVWELYAKDQQGNEAGHAMPVFGYRITPYGKFYILYTTWGKTAAQQRQEWNYVYWPGRGPVSRTEIITLRPVRGDDRGQLVLQTPDGGETVARGVATTIRWYQWGTRLRFATIDLSTDGGRTWSALARGVVTQEGWNEYRWTPQTTTAKARVRIAGYDYNTEHLAGDGSSDNFRIQ
jgi:hypothetical protein